MIVGNQLLYPEYLLVRCGFHPVSRTWYGWRAKVCAMNLQEKLLLQNKTFRSGKLMLIRYLPFIHKSGLPRMKVGKKLLPRVGSLHSLFRSLMSCIRN